MLPVVGPNFQAHLSAFSWPLVSYQALRSGSVAASSDSCAMIDAIPSAPLSPLGLTVCISQADGHRSGFPTKAYLMSELKIVACVCQPQYWLQKPEVSRTSEDVSTKYTPLVLLGSLPLLMALETTAFTPESRNRFPCE